MATSRSKKGNQAVGQRKQKDVVGPKYSKSEGQIDKKTNGPIENYREIVAETRTYLRKKNKTSDKDASRCVYRHFTANKKLTIFYNHA